MKNKQSRYQQLNNNDTPKEILYTLEWEDIENAEIEYENYLNDIEHFFTEDFDDEEPGEINNNETTK